MSKDEKSIVPEGWQEFQVGSEYAMGLAPLYVSNDPVGLGFIPTAKHTNLNGVVHGGALATLADIGLFIIASGGKDTMNGATLSLNLNYLLPAQPNRFVHCTGRIVREGSSILFVEGSLFDQKEELLTFNGVIKRFRTVRR